VLLVTAGHHARLVRGAQQHAQRHDHVNPGRWQGATEPAHVDTRPIRLGCGLVRGRRGSAGRLRSLRSFDGRNVAGAPAEETGFRRRDLPEADEVEGDVGAQLGEGALIPGATQHARDAVDALVSAGDAGGVAADRQAAGADLRVEDRGHGAAAQAALVPLCSREDLGELVPQPRWEDLLWDA